MERINRLHNIWSWLPHFRVVGELENLTKSSRRFHVSPSALSKALRLLEGELEVDLFVRDGGKLRLNESGRVLLHAVRSAMRDIDDAVAQVITSAAPKRLRVACESHLVSSWFTPRCTFHLGLQFDLVAAPRNMQRALMRGDVDVVLGSSTIEHPEVTSSQIGALPQVLACHPSDALVALQAKQGSVSSDDLHNAEFAVSGRKYLRSETALLGEPWPPSLQKSPVMRCETVEQLAAILRHSSPRIVNERPMRLIGIVPTTVAEQYGLKALMLKDVVLPDLPVALSYRTPRTGTPPEIAAWFQSLANAPG